MQMGVNRGIKIPPETVNPIPRRTEKGSFFFVLHGSGRFGVRLLLEVRFAARLLGVENGRIKSAVKISVGLGKKLVGEEPPAVAHQRDQNISRSIVAIMQRPKLRIQNRRQRHTADEQEHHDEANHNVSTLRLKTSQAQPRSMPV